MDANEMPSQSSTDDSDNSATEETPASRYGWIMPLVTGVVTVLFDNSALRLGRIVEAQSDAVDMITPRTSTAVDAAFADLKSFMSTRLSDLLAIILDKLRQLEQELQEQQRVHAAEIRELKQTIDAHEQDLNAEILELKKDMRLLLESREGSVDLSKSARSIKRRRSEAIPEPSTTQLRD